jgi:hypothetical protein
MTDKINTGKVIEKIEAGSTDVTPAEQRAYDKAMAEAADEKGYEPFSYHNRPMFRVLESPSHTFSNEQDAVAFVTSMRFTRNLNESA